MRIKLIVLTLFACLVLAACSSYGTERAPSPKWIAHIGSGSDTWINDPVAVSNGMIFVAAAEPRPGRWPWSEDHYLQGLDAADGRFKWHMDAGGFKEGQPVIDGETVFFASGGSGSNLYAIDPVTGVPRWKLPVSLSAANSPTVSDGVVYIESDSPNGRVLALDSRSGALVWEYALRKPEQLSVAVSDEMVYFVADRMLRAVDKETGELRWQFNPEFLYSVAPVTDGDKVFVMASEKRGDRGGLYALDAATGTKLWSVPIERGGFRQLDIQDGVAFIGTNEFTEYGLPWTPTAFLYAVDLESQSLKWRFDMTSPSGNVLGVEDTLYFSNYYTLYAMDAETGKVKWTFQREGLTDPTIADGVLYVGDQKGDLYAIPLRD